MARMTATLRRSVTAALVALSLAALADDPVPGSQEEPQQKSEDRFDEFMRTWRSIGAHMTEGATRTFKVEGTGAEVPITGTMVVVAHTPEPEVVAWERKLTLDRKDELVEKRVQLPPLLASNRWLEPPPIMFPEKGRATLEKDVELKIGEKTLKCQRLTVTTPKDAPTPDLNMTFLICPEDNLGLVGITMTSAAGRTLKLELVSWQAGEK